MIAAGADPDSPEAPAPPGELSAALAAIIPNYGKFAGREDAVCLGKRI